MPKRESSLDSPDCSCAMSSTIDCRSQMKHKELYVSCCRELSSVGRIAELNALWLLTCCNQLQTWNWR